MAEDIRDHVTGVSIMAECIERGLSVAGLEEVQMLVTRQDVTDLRALLSALEVTREALRNGCVICATGYAPGWPTGPRYLSVNAKGYHRNEATPDVPGGGEWCTLTPVARAALALVAPSDKANQ